MKRNRKAERLVLPSHDDSFDQKTEPVNKQKSSSRTPKEEKTAAPRRRNNTKKVRSREEGPQEASSSHRVEKRCKRESSAKKISFSSRRSIQEFGFFNSEEEILKFRNRKFGRRLVPHGDNSEDDDCDTDDEQLILAIRLITKELQTALKKIRESQLEPIMEEEKLKLKYLSRNAELEVTKLIERGMNGKESVKKIERGQTPQPVPEAPIDAFRKKRTNRKEIV